VVVDKAVGAETAVVRPESGVVEGGRAAGGQARARLGAPAVGDVRGDQAGAGARFCRQLMSGTVPEALAAAGKDRIRAGAESYPASLGPPIGVGAPWRVLLKVRDQPLAGNSGSAPGSGNAARRAGEKARRRPLSRWRSPRP
jgi:hypothetical protein